MTTIIPLAPNPATVRDAAREARNAGVCVVPPTEDGQKRPAGASWKDYQHRQPTLGEFKGWYREDRTGIGAIMGAASGGMELLEFDDAPTYTAFKEAAAALDLGMLVERIEGGYSERTPGGGIHWFYRCATIDGNTKLACRPGPSTPEGRRTVEVLIETRGEGGYAVLAPSHGRVHPSGRPYELLRGSFSTIATITPEERRDLWTLARTFDLMPTGTEDQHSATACDTRNGGRPGDDFAARTDWGAILEPHGWSRVFRRDGTDHWRRPGKALGVSATTNHAASDLLYVFSTSTNFEAGRGYGKFSAYAVLNHEGDFAAAARALAEEGYGDAQQASGVPTKAGSGEFSRSRVFASGVNAAIIPPSFPTDALPGALRQLVVEGAQALDAPAEFIGVPALVFAAGCIGSTRCIELKRGFRQYPVLYAAIVGLPSSGKSPGLSLARQPLDRLQRDAVARYEAEHVAYQAVVDSATQGDPLGKPALEHFYTTDPTVEALAMMLTTSPGVVNTRDELVSWVKSMDAYRGGKGGDRQRWLSAWSDEPWKVDRKGGDPIYIPHPAISVIGGMQPDVLRELRHEAGARDGFIERLLWAAPEAKMPGWTEETVAEQTIQEVYTQFAALRDGATGADEPAIITLSPDAKARFVAWYEANMRQVAGATGLVQGIYAKLPQQLARLALVLHCLTWGGLAPTRMVTPETMEGAIALVEYFRAHAHRVLPAFGGTDDDEPLVERVIRYLRAQGDWVTRSALRDHFHRNIASSALTQALEHLEEEGRAERRINGEKGSGRKPEQWRVTVDAGTR